VDGLRALGEMLGVSIPQEIEGWEPVLGGFRPGDPEQAHGHTVILEAALSMSRRSSGVIAVEAIRCVGLSTAAGLVGGCPSQSQPAGYPSGITRR
jgi:hypothetical protein